MICADSSVVTKWLFPEEEHGAIAQLLLTDQIVQREEIIAPLLLRDEVTNVVRKKIRKEGFPSDRIDAILDYFLSLPIAYRDPDHHFHNALHLAVTYSLPAIYDAEYIALAMLAKCEFWTDDLKLVRAVQSQLPFVRPLREYEPAT